MERQACIKLAGENAEQYRLQGFHCSESSIRAVAELLGLELTEDILRIASVFRGGGGGYGDRCGVVEAGLMLIGYLYGRADASVPEKGYSLLAQEWQKRFKMEFVSLYCRDILPVALKASAETGRLAVGATGKSCSRTYIVGTELLMEMMLDAPPLCEPAQDA